MPFNAGASKVKGVNFFLPAPAIVFLSMKLQAQQEQGWLRDE